MIDGPEQKPTPEHLATWQGYKLLYDPDLANGWVKLCDSNGYVIAMISDVNEIHIARAAIDQSSPPKASA